MKTKFSFACVAAVLAALALPAAAATTPDAPDRGYITAIYVSSSGNIALQLSGQFPNATSSQQCLPPPSGLYNGWAGVVNPDPRLVATIMIAKATGAFVKVTTAGCTAGGYWLNMINIYVCSSASTDPACQ